MEYVPRCQHRVIPQGCSLAFHVPHKASLCQLLGDQLPTVMDTELEQQLQQVVSKAFSCSEARAFKFCHFSFSNKQFSVLPLC